MRPRSRLIESLLFRCEIAADPRPLGNAALILLTVSARLDDVLGCLLLAELRLLLRLIGSERAILFVALRAIDSLKVLLCPFLPFSAQRLHELLGYDDVIAGPLAFESVSEGDAEHVVLTGDYAGWAGRWEPSRLSPGQKLREPAPLFAKLDAERVAEEELARMEAATTA